MSAYHSPKRALIYRTVFFSVVAFIGMCFAIWPILWLVISIWRPHTLDPEFMIFMAWLPVGVKVSWDMMVNCVEGITQKFVHGWRNQFVLNACSWPLFLILGVRKGSMGLFDKYSVHFEWKLLAVACWGAALTLVSWHAWNRARSIHTQQELDALDVWC